MSRQKARLSFEQVGSIKKKPKKHWLNYFLKIFNISRKASFFSLKGLEKLNFFQPILKIFDIFHTQVTFQLFSPFRPLFNFSERVRLTRERSFFQQKLKCLKVFSVPVKNVPLSFFQNSLDFIILSKQDTLKEPLEFRTKASTSCSVYESFKLPS